MRAHETVGEAPQLVFRVKARAFQTEGIDYVSIPWARFDVHLLSSGTDEGLIGSENLTEPLLLSKGASFEGMTDFRLSVNTRILEKMAEIRARGKLVGFDVEVAFLFITYAVSQGGGYATKEMQKLVGYKVYQITPTGDRVSKITFSTEDYYKAMSFLKKFEIMRIEIPLYRATESLEKNIQEATVLLQNAAEKMAHANYSGALWDARKAVANHLLTEFRDVQGRKVRSLKNELREKMLRSMPQETESVNKEIVKRVEVILRSALNIIHKFVHEDGTLLAQPSPTDVEFAYFTIGLALKYISATSAPL